MFLLWRKTLQQAISCFHDVTNFKADKNVAAKEILNQRWNKRSWTTKLTLPQ